MTVQQTTTSVQRLRRNRRTTTSKQADIIIINQSCTASLPQGTGKSSSLRSLCTMACI